MNVTVASVLAVAESLTVAERHELIDRLLNGLPTDDSDSLVLSEKWKQEISR